MVVGAAFAAVWIGLAVRIINRRDRWAKWTLAIVCAIPALYALSFGPACWRASRPFGKHGAIAGADDGRIPVIYWPLCAEARHSSGIPGKAINWYARVGMPPGRVIWLPNDSSGFAWDMMSTSPGGVPIPPPAVR